MFEMLTEEKRALYAESIATCTIEEREKERQGENIVLDVYLKDTRFIARRTEEEMMITAKLVIEIMEELKKLNNDGLNADVLKKSEIAGIDPHKEPMKYTIAINNTLCTPELKTTVQTLMQISRVGGAYALFIAMPQFMSILYACYEVIVDRFDEEKTYYQVADFMFRGALYIHSKELPPEETD